MLVYIMGKITAKDFFLLFQMNLKGRKNIKNLNTQHLQYEFQYFFL